MFRETVDSVAASAEKKLDFLRSTPAGYIAASMLAGMFVAFGGFVSLAVGGVLSAAGSAFTKLAAAFVFTSALSLVIMAGCELFTGNNLVMGVGVLTRRVGLVDAMKLWLICWLGNYFGAWLAVAIYWFTGLVSGPTADYIASVAAAKLSLTAPQAGLRGVLCNALVCLAVWCSVRMKSESGKLIMVFWCIMVFMLCGFEHSVATMSILGLALLTGAAGFWQYVLNVGIVTLGNIFGGVLLVALPYWLSGRKAL